MQVNVVGHAIVQLIAHPNSLLVEADSWGIYQELGQARLLSLRRNVAQGSVASLSVI
jgi:hypothetical protein